MGARTTRGALLLIAAAELAMWSTAGAAYAVRKTGKPAAFDCGAIADDNAVLQDALDNALPGAVITVTGPCNGLDLIIDTDSVTLMGPSSGAPAVLVGSGAGAVVGVLNARGVKLANLDVAQGSSGIALVNAAALVTEVVAHDNGIGIVSLDQSELTCLGCEARDNGQWGLGVHGAGATLCGENTFVDNATTGILVSLSGNLEGTSGVGCFLQLAPPLDLTVSGSSPSNGITVVGGTLLFAAGSTVDISGVRWGIVAVDNAVFATDGSNVSIHSNDIGVIAVRGASVRLNEGPGGSVDISQNFGPGMVVRRSGFLSAAASIKDNNLLFGFADILVEQFSVVDIGDQTNVGPRNCEPGRSAGNVCP